VADREQVGAHNDKGRFPFGRPDSEQDLFADARILPGIRKEPAGTLDPEHDFELEAGVTELLGELVGVVELRGGEPLDPAIGVAVLAFPQVSLDDLAEGRVAQVAAPHPVEEGSEPRDRGGGDHPARANHPAGLGQSGDSPGPLGEVVERTEHEDRVVRGVGLREAPGVPEGGREGPRRSLRRRGRLSDVKGNGIDEMDPVPHLGQPCCVRARAAANVQHRRRRRREEPEQELLRPLELDPRGPWARRSRSTPAS
jgi:hypothetical protein